MEMTDDRRLSGRPLCHRIEGLRDKTAKAIAFGEVVETSCIGGPARLDVQGLAVGERNGILRVRRSTCGTRHNPDSATIDRSALEDAQPATVRRDLDILERTSRRDPALVTPTGRGVDEPDRAGFALSCGAAVQDPSVYGPMVRSQTSIADSRRLPGGTIDCRDGGPSGPSAPNAIWLPSALTRCTSCIGEKPLHTLG